jgi:hypothetical protein
MSACERDELLRRVIALEAGAQDAGGLSLQGLVERIRTRGEDPFACSRVLAAIADVFGFEDSLAVRHVSDLR